MKHIKKAIEGNTTTLEIKKARLQAVLVYLRVMAGRRVSTGSPGPESNRKMASARQKDKEKHSKKSNKSSSTSSLVHCVCNSQEDVGKMVECEECHQWTHCKCVGLLPSTASSYPFVCPFCIKSLFSRLSAVKSRLENLSDRVSSIQTTTENEGTSLTRAIQEVRDSTTQITQVLNKPQSTMNNTSPARASSAEQLSCHRRYNIVVTGVTESPRGTSYAGRLNADVDAVSTILTNLASSIESPLPFQIRNCRRLGRYKADSLKPRSANYIKLLCRGFYYSL